MKKFLCLLLAMVMCLSLVACGGSEKSNVSSVEDKVRNAVKANIQAELLVNYDTVGVPEITCYIDEVGDNVYEVTGKVTVKDKYGDSYTGKYDANVEYDPATDECTTNVELDSLYKD